MSYPRSGQVVPEAHSAEDAELAATRMLGYPLPMSTTTTVTATVPVYVTSGLVRLTKPQLIGTMTGLLLAALLAAIDQTIVGTAEPRIIASLQGFDRYPWVATIYMLTSTVSVPIFASLSDRYGRKPFFMLGATLFVVSSALAARPANSRSCRPTAWAS